MSITVFTKCANNRENVQRKQSITLQTSTVEFTMWWQWL